MFKSKGGIERLQDITSIQGSQNSTVPLKTAQIKIIENSSALSLTEKLDLLAISLGLKLTTEVFKNIKYKYNPKDQKELALNKTVVQVKNALEKLPFPHFEDTITKKSRQTGHLREYRWLQVCINEKVLYLMKRYAEDLTEMELGLLYGFPHSAILAFSGLINPEKPKPKSSAEHFFMGVPSKDFRLEERNFYSIWWKKLKKLSPRLIKVAEHKSSSFLRVADRQ